MLRMVIVLCVGLQLLQSASVMAQMVTDPNWIFDETRNKVEVVKIDLVRGEAMIVRRPGPVSVHIIKHSATGRAEEVSLKTSNESGVLKITDIYPKNILNRWKECLPISFRGNFSSSDVRFKATILAPENVEVNVEFMDGRVAGALAINLAF
jgi:hypothetical protein